MSKYVLLLGGLAAGVHGTEYTLFEGATSSSSGADLDLYMPLSSWNDNYTMKISFTMPSDGISSDREGLLGHSSGDHPYPYFNADGLWFEKQNGPHPEIYGLPVSCFGSGAEMFTVTFEHWQESEVGDCFSMAAVSDTDGSSSCDPVEWCYDYTYFNAPVYAGCGYGKTSEVFSGSVTKITFDGKLELSAYLPACLLNLSALRDIGMPPDQVLTHRFVFALPRLEPVCPLSN